MNELSILSVVFAAMKAERMPVYRRLLAQKTQTKNENRIETHSAVSCVRDVNMFDETYEWWCSVRLIINNYVN